MVSAVLFVCLFVFLRLFYNAYDFTIFLFCFVCVFFIAVIFVITSLVEGFISPTRLADCELFFAVVLLFSEKITNSGPHLTFL